VVTNPPTARACIQELVPPPEHTKKESPGYVGYATELAARVEKVLALAEYCKACGEYWPDQVLEILNGEEP
jgi:hypothetical protein